MRRVIFFFLFIALILFTQIFTVGCANIIPPTGGPRDSIPPVLISANPKDSITNFKGNRITLTFDEYIDLQDVQNNLLFTPLFETVPVVEVRLKTINVRLRDTLEANTTYTFNFGNAIKDINEGNPFREFTYTFSTGAYLDSLQLKGRVLLAETGKIDTTLTMVLHTDFTDSAVAKNRPRYAARLDSSGSFIFRNLPRDTFAIYAIGEAGTIRRYTSPAQFFAFADAPVVAGSTEPMVLYAYQEDNRPATPRTTTQQAPRANTAAERRLRYSLNLNNNQQDLLSDLVFTFERPLRNLDTTKLRLTTDSTFTPLAEYTVRTDTTGKQLHIATRWQEGQRYNLIVDSTFAEDTTGRRLAKSDTVRFNTRKRSDYGRIELRLRNADTAQNPVLQFVQSDKVVFAVPIKSGLFVQELFVPGDYELRLLYDRNGNGIWDAGRFYEGKRQPEIALPIDRNVNVKADYENEFDIAAPQ